VRARRRAASSAKAGYSLLEILIVLTIIALIAAFVGPRLLAQLDKSKVTAARVQIRALQTAIGTMHLDIGRYPTASEGLNLLVTSNPSAQGWAGPYLSGGVPLDPWRHPYVYEAPAEANGQPKVFSYGADGKPGGQGLDADITNDAGA
jgi:general secretion pathway protein G